MRKLRFSLTFLSNMPRRDSLGQVQDHGEMPLRGRISQVWLANPHTLRDVGRVSDVPALTIPASRLCPGETPWTGPLAFIDLAGEADPPDRLRLPPCPVIGIGDAAHPLAARLDAVVEPPITARAMATQVLATPKAAAVFVQALRVLPALPVADALAMESLAYAVLQGSAEHLHWRAGLRATAPAGEGRVTVELDDGNRLVVTLDNLAAGNAIDRAMRDRLREAFDLAALDTSIRISLRARGRSFSLGAELSEFGTTGDPATAHRIRALTLPALAASRCGERFDVHVQGGCVGAGLEIAAWARRFTAASNAWFHLPELSMGILPGAGGCVSLSRRIGRQRTALLVLSGKRINARQALGWGLVDAIVDEPPRDESGADVV